MIKREKILDQLDKCSSEFTFPMLDNGYVYPAGTKLTAYRDDKRWVIIIEAIGFNYRGGGHNGIANCLHVYGNCLSYKPGTRNENFLYLTDDADDCSTFDEEESFYLNPACDSFKLRGSILPLIQDRNQYKSLGIDIEDETRINAFEFVRLLDALHHEKLVATETEIRERVPNDIPRIIELHDWFHPDVINGESPSENETFKQIAEVLETGDVVAYRPTHKPNTHWKNWPEGGTL
ncbi:MAG TPA: hypothetical protein VEY06_10160 [Flavisolibacter sp.]|jgi:hypothetical protein|nr:hypothetical protein [Flavisolibacter sp.]